MFSIQYIGYVYGYSDDKVIVVFTLYLLRHFCTLCLILYLNLYGIPNLIILYYTILYYTILYYTNLYYTILYCTILYYTILYSTILNYFFLAHGTPIDWYNFCREVSEDIVINNSEKIGGVGITVEIDESKFGKRKYNRGKRVEGSIQPKSPNRWRAHIFEFSEIWTVGLYYPK
ncbi:Uncharacterized protein APZ42_006686 [Daphnia magna]|uniref:Uncharacterized protein n=1 Tax=Daphnia magna TaxID=35525 RepID=A0A164FRF8_9CRUS|nr:Uncharacterized protein APZ42_006686 [Daphnia magna]